MKRKIKICGLLTLISSFSMILGYLVNYNQVEANNEKCFNGIRAIPFEDRYSNSDLTNEPNQSNFFSYNYRYMGTGGTSLSNSTIWNNYRGETASGDPVVVAVIDSGIDIFHEDFIIEEGLDVNLTFDNIEQYSTLHPKSAHIYDSTGNGYYELNVVTDVGIPYVYDTDVYDSKYNEYYSHGTAVSSTIASAINGKGGFGVAPMAQIMFIKMDFYFNSLSVAIKYAADNGADIINMSLGAYAESFTDGFGDSQTGSSGVATALSSAISYAHSRDVVVVAAAGNEDTYRKSYPACNDGVIGVGALEEKSAAEPAYYTNYNSNSDSSTGNNNVDVVAPGCVYTAQYPQKAVREEGSSARADSYYSTTQGTSFASPLTAGAIALYRGAHPGDSRTKVIDELFNSCDDIGDSGWDAQYGHGRVNLTEFVNTGIAVTEVNISPSTATLNMTNDNPNPTVQLSASFLPSDANDEYKEGLWISNDDSVATVDENTGLVTAVGKGQTDITFITERDMIEGVCTVTVTDSVERPVTGISLDQTSMTVGLNKTRQLTATITPTNASNQNINWTTSNSSVATVDNGLVFGKSLGTATITATTQDGNFIATCDVTVEKIQGGSFTINRASHTANNAYAWQPWTSTTNDIPISGESYIYGDTKDKMQFNDSKDSYYIYNNVETPDDISKITIYLNSTTTDTDRMNWSVRTSTSSFGQVEGLPTGGTLYSKQQISTSGTSFDINGGTYFAICYEGSGATYLDSVVVEYGGGSTTNPDSISLNNTSLSLEVDETATLIATATGEVSWKSDDTGVATVSDEGLVTAIGAGDTTITATCGTATATCAVRVTQNSGNSNPIEPEPTAEGYTLVTDVSSLKANDKVVIAATGYNYALSKTQNGNNRGQAAITKSDNTITLTSNVDELTLGSGTTSGTYSFYSSSNTGYLYAASSSSNYLRTEATLSANSSWSITITSAGVATIKAQGTNTRNWLRYNNSSSIFSCYSGDQQDVCIYKYYESTSVTNPDSITITPSTLTLDLYNNISSTLVASVSPSGASQEVTWTSGTEGVATVSDEGLVTAVSKGTATITATSAVDETIKGTCTVTVNDSTPAPILITNIELTGNFDASYSGSDLNDYDKFINLDVYNNKTQQINVSYTPSDATNKSVSWVSSDSNIVSVSNGLLTAKGEGSAVITVTTSDGSNISKTIKVTVTNQTPVLSSISVSNIPETVKWRSQFDTSGIIVTANYTYGDSKTVSASFSGIDTSTIGEKEVTATYTEGGITKTTKFEVFVTNKDVERNEIPGESSTYDSGDFGTTNKNTFTSNGQTVDINGKGIDWTINTDTTYFGYDSNNKKGAQIGSGNNPCDTATISSSDFDTTITSVIVEASIAKDGNCTIAVYVGGVMFNPASKALTASNTTYTFTGSAKGEVKIIYTNNAAKAVYFRSVSVTTSEPGGYDWSGDDQATSYISYLKTFSSCASSWTDRNDIVRLVNEFNYMIQESKDSTLFLETFTDNGGYSTSSLDKLKMIVKEYNNTLQEGEAALSLVLSVDEQGNPIFFYKGENKTMILNINTVFSYIALIGVGLLCFTGFIVFKKTKQN